MGLPQLLNEIREFPRKKWSGCFFHLSGVSADFGVGLIIVYLLGVGGYIYGMRNWTLAEDSLYWRDSIERY